MAGVGDILGEIGKGAVGAGKGAANWLTDVIFKNPVEVLKNPASVLNDRGEVSVTRLLFPDFRRQRVAEQESAMQAQQMEAQAKALASYGDIAKMFLDAPTDTAQGELRKGLVEQGLVDEGLSKRLGAAAKSARHESRQAGTQAGLLPEVANLATPDTARQAGQSQFTDRLAREQNVQQAGLTRGNQSHADDLARQRHMDLRQYDISNPMPGDIGEMTPDSAMGLWGALDDKQKKGLPENVRILGEQGAAGNPAAAAAFGKQFTSLPKSTASERLGQKSIKNLRRLKRGGQLPEEIRPLAKAALRSGDVQQARELTRGLARRKLSPTNGDFVATADSFMQRPEFATLSPAVQETIRDGVVRGDNAMLKPVMTAIIARQTGAADRLLSNPEYRKMREDAAASDDALAGIGAAQQAATVSTNDGTGIDPNLFGPMISRLSPENQLLWARSAGYGDDWVNRKQQVWTYASESLAKALRARFGGHASDQDMKLISTGWITGNEPSAAVFATKVEAIRRFEERRKEALDRRAERMKSAVESGNVDMLADPSSAAELAGIAATLGRELLQAERDPKNMPDVPLSPEQIAEMGR